MIKVQNLSYAFPQKDLYSKISFTIEEDAHCALIGINGTGKSTLLDIFMHTEDYLYDGKIEIDNMGRTGYVSQFSQLDPQEDLSVLQYISDEFVKLEQKIADLCKQMEPPQIWKLFLRIIRKLQMNGMRLMVTHMKSILKNS